MFCGCIHTYIFPPSRAGGFLRRERPVVEERRRARAACDLEGNRAGLGCLEHLGNALSFAVVTEWPVRVYPRRRCRSPPHACLAGGWPIPPVRVYAGSKEGLSCCWAHHVWAPCSAAGAPELVLRRCAQQRPEWPRRWISTIVGSICRSRKPSERNAAMACQALM